MGSPNISSVGYVLTNYAPLTKPISVKARFSLSASGATWLSTDHYDTCPCRVRLMFMTSHSVYEDQGKPMQDIPYEFRRWWASASYTLQSTSDGNNVIEFNVPYDPSLWSSVFGKYGTNPDVVAGDWFNRAVAGMVETGVSFGGQSFYGHGVMNDQDPLLGTATFYLLSYEFTFPEVVGN